MLGAFDADDDGVLDVFEFQSFVRVRDGLGS